MNFLKLSLMLKCFYSMKCGLFLLSEQFLVMNSLVPVVKSEMGCTSLECVLETEVGAYS